MSDFSSSEIPNSSDCISRRAAIDTVAEGLKGVFFESRDIAEKTINKLPSVQPDLSSYSEKLWREAYERGKAEAQKEKPTGRWMTCKQDFRFQLPWFECSGCGMEASTRYNFCPNCGAKMEGHNETD